MEKGKYRDGNDACMEDEELLNQSRIHHYKLNNFQSLLNVILVNLLPLSPLSPLSVSYLCWIFQLVPHLTAEHGRVQLVDCPLDYIEF